MKPRGTGALGALPGPAKAWAQVFLLGAGYPPARSGERVAPVLELQYAGYAHDRARSICIANLVCLRRASEE